MGNLLDQVLLVRATVPSTFPQLDPAAGHVDVYWQYECDLIGVAAGVLFVSEAGGMVTDLLGEPWQPRATDVLAAAREPAVDPQGELTPPKEASYLYHLPRIRPLSTDDRDASPGDGAGDGVATGTEETGTPLASAWALMRSSDPQAAAALIESRGADIIAAGSATDLIALIEHLPSAERHRYGVELNRADALRTVGEPLAAAAAFDALDSRTDENSPPETALAWRRGMLHYMQGEYARAEAICRQAETSHPARGTVLDLVLTEVCRVSALVALGQTELSVALAQQALRRAGKLGSDRALAAAHLAVALTSCGTRRDEHLAQALAAAERGNDVLAQARALTNQVDGLLRQARYPQALELAQRAVTVAERGSPPGLLVTALFNQGEVLLRLGLFDDAAGYFERVVRTSRRVGLNRTAMGLWGVGEVHRQCGRRQQARAAFEEAVDLARDVGDVQILVPALTGLSQLLLEGPDYDVGTAKTLVQEAQQVAPNLWAATALVAATRLALAVGDLAAAQKAAAEAVAIARSERRTDHLAEALELSAAASADPAQVRSLLHEAEAIWRQAGAVAAADRIAALVGRLPGAGGEERAAGRAASHRLAALGVRGIAIEAGCSADGPAAPVRIRVLGGFEVLVCGRPVAFSAWRSKQARTLVKILVARRGRPVHRGEVCEVLWPDDAPARTAHRLSVLLSVVRNVLDPQHLWPVDHYLRADPAGLVLDQAHLEVDAEGLLRDAAFARALLHEGESGRAHHILDVVDHAYRGTAFEEEPFEDWAVGLREEVRAVWLRCLRELADLHRAGGDLRQAVTVLTRLLGEDPYDEDSHHRLVRLLVRSGRHGEANRAYQRWAQAMGQIGAPEPDSDVLGLRVP